jgi:VWFA-related protein
MASGRVDRRGFLSLAAARLFGQATFSTGVNVVNVFATVRDRSGKIVDNLGRDDFLIEEDGRPQQIRYFARQSDLPLTLGLLVDTSLSQARVLESEKKASRRFVEKVLREDRDSVFLIHFDFEVVLLQDLTSSRKSIESALDKLAMPEQPRLQRRVPGAGTPPGGRRPPTIGGPRAGTTLYDAVLLASDEIMKRQAGRKALIVLSDGVDFGSKVRIGDAIEAAQRTGTLVYSIRFADDGPARAVFLPRGRRGRGRMERSGKEVLEEISAASGAAAFEAGRDRSLDAIYDRIEEELRNQYSLGFTPDLAGEPGQYRKLRVTTRRKGLLVQARDGYYVPRS